ncbi:unnamed protein product [Xylocopa violacea]
MTGIKDPTEPPKVEIIKQEKETMDAIVRKSFSNLTNICMQDFCNFSKDMTETFRSMLENLKVRIEQFHEQNRSIFDLFSLSQLQKWSQREQ